MASKPDPFAARKFRAAMRMSMKALPAHLPALLYLVDPKRGPNFLETAVNLPAGSGVVYRHFGDKNRLDIARRLRHITLSTKSILLIGNDAQLAKRVRADGVHWSESIISNSAQWRSTFTIMTTAAHSRKAVHHARMLGLDAALYSCVFPSRSPSASKPTGAVKFRLLSKQLDFPIYALGGVSAHNAGRVADAGGLATVEGAETTFGS